MGVTHSPNGRFGLVSKEKEKVGETTVFSNPTLGEIFHLMQGKKKPSRNNLLQVSLWTGTDALRLVQEKYSGRELAKRSQSETARSSCVPQGALPL